MINDFDNIPNLPAIFGQASQVAYVGDIQLELIELIGDTPSH